MSKPKYPKVLYVKIEDGGTGPDYFSASEDAGGMVEVGEKATMGLYVLRELRAVEGVINDNKIVRKRGK